MNRVGFSPVVWLRRLLLLSLFLVSLVWLAAELLQIGPKAELERWSNGISFPNKETVESVHQLLALAGKLQPWDADLDLMRCQVALRRASMAMPPDREWLDIANRRVREALFLRTQWTRGWGWFAVVQYFRGNVVGQEQGSFTILRRMLRTASREIDNYHVYILLGFLHWKLLTEDERGLVDHMLEQYYWRNKPGAVVLAYRFGRLPTLRRIDPGREHLELLKRMKQVGARG